jgi:S1-C subfamily serine protease
MELRERHEEVGMKGRRTHRALGWFAALAAATALGAGAAVGVLTAAADDAAPVVTQTVVPAQQASLDSTSLTPAEIYTQSAAGVVDVKVTTTSVDPWGRERSEQAEGTGFVVDRKGHIVTAAHVVDGATAITVTFKDGTRAKATIVGTEASADLALIRVKVASGKMQPLELADSRTVRTGDPVVAIGSAFGYRGSITSGIVSAVGRRITAPNQATITNAIQTDAAINSGNSGGPLIDVDGRVIGVATQIASTSGGNEGVGFAVPSNAVKALLSRVLGYDL